MSNSELIPIPNSEFRIPNSSLAGNRETFHPDAGADAAGGDFWVFLDVDNRVEDFADIAGNGRGIDTDFFAFIHQPAVEGEGEGTLEGVHSGVEGAEVVD